ncbi:hypothetical protein M405DRAFT_247849 [Rhizopogon salebrosus TDB-379]|nr:hypothetical protein M405DRAFT_247849 [Rhizopogon salebrosus TDB-379]
MLNMTLKSSWCAPNRPCILVIYLTTWSASSRSSFDIYRDIVRRQSRLPNGNEVKCFRAERRACHLCEPGRLSLCHQCHRDCKLYDAIRTGFKSTLAHSLGDMIFRAASDLVMASTQPPH